MDARERPGMANPASRKAAATITVFNDRLLRVIITDTSLMLEMDVKLIALAFANDAKDATRRQQSLWFSKIPVERPFTSLSTKL
jgi:hypothetical protein